ncbi:MAG: hypothetical protein ABEJ28_04790 [Salinigranum sp.]
MTQKLIVMPKDKYVAWARSHGQRVPFADNSTSSGGTAGDLSAGGVS